MLHDITSMKTGIYHSHHHQNPVTGHEGAEKEQRNSPTFSLTFVLDGSGWSMPHPSRCTSGQETWYPLHRRLGGPQGRSPPHQVSNPDRPFCSESLHWKSWVIKQCHFKCGNYVVSNRMVKLKSKLVYVYTIRAFIINPGRSQLVSLTHGHATRAEGTHCNHQTDSWVGLHSPCHLENKNISYLSGYETQLVIWDGKMILTESARHGLSEHCHSRHLSCWYTSSTAIYSCTGTVHNIPSKQYQCVQGITICSDKHHLVTPEQTSTPLTCLNGIVRHNFTL